MIIVESLVASVESLVDIWRNRDRLPTVEELRPASCPLCHNPAHGEAGRLGIVGHGTYERQVLGLVSILADIVIHIRRFLCRRCGSTMSVLPDQLHPRRWYAAVVIFEALRLQLVEERSESEIRKRFAPSLDESQWRSLRRWRKELGVTLWACLSARLGFAKDLVTSREEGRRRLLRLASEGAGTSPDDPARGLLRGTVHARSFTWFLGHDAPSALTNRSPP